jgi:cytochrome c oxidase accessory protein FixG
MVDRVDEKQIRTEGSADSDSLRSDARATNSATWRTLYKAREPIYPKTVKGVFRRVKWAVMAVLLAIYYIVPFIRWDRGIGKPDQAVLVDLDRPRLYFFWLELWPQEVYFLAGLLIASALGLFLFTALFGRVWCGYACPQTVWTDLFLAVERFFEGDRTQQIRLSKQPWNVAKLARKAGKHATWLAIAFATGGAWVLYFYDAPTFLGDFATGHAPLMAYAFVGGLTFTTYALAGFMREQVCTFMCPWPRIQAAMIDSESMSVTYLKARGEPRGAHKKGTSWDGRGDCIDCNQCIAACPMGIDIRDGDQLECINCGLCIDACDDIMDKVGRPAGLIAYESNAGIARRAAGTIERTRFLRARTILYALLLAAVGGVMLTALVERSTLDLNVLHDRNPVFVRLSNGDIRNAYTVKVMNRSAAPMSVELSLENLPEAIISEGGNTTSSDSTGKRITVSVNPDELRSIRLLATLPASRAGEGTQQIRMIAVDTASGATASSQTNFIAGNQP